MTDIEAAQEAERRWGAIGYARDRHEHQPPLAPRYVVGVISNKERDNRLVHGEGATWEAAFTEADERAEFLKPYMQDLR